MDWVFLEGEAARWGWGKVRAAGISGLSKVDVTGYRNAINVCSEVDGEENAEW